MAEMHVTADPAEELAAIGLGSCIALAMLDRTARVAGLAHVVLPEGAGLDGPPAKFADRVVPVLLDELLRAGAARHRLEAAIAGGASMFAVGSVELGARNEITVRQALAAARLRLYATATGGTRGRTLKVKVGEGVVVVKEAGLLPQVLLERATRLAARPRTTPARKLIRQAVMGAAA
jgi:chemotaxis protein CheD